MFKFLLYKFGELCVNYLPLPFVYRWATLLSDMQYYFSPRDRKAVTNNLKIILNRNDNIQPLVKEVFRNFGRYLVEFFRMKEKLDLKFIEQNVKIHNLEVLDKVLQQGKGAIVTTAHIGNWEMGGVMLSILGYHIMAIALPHKERPVNDLFNRQREFKGVTIVPMHLAIRPCLDTLRSNGIVALLADRDFTANGEIMDFFGKPTLIPKGAAIFSVKTGAPVILIFLTREKDNTFILTLEEPIYPPETSDKVEAGVLWGLMHQYKTIIEEKISQYPTQWLMFRKFWVDSAS